MGNFKFISYNLFKHKFEEIHGSIEAQEITWNKIKKVLYRLGIKEDDYEKSEEKQSKKNGQS